MRLPVEIIDTILLHINNQDLIILFYKFMSKKTIIKLLEKTTINEQIKKDNIDLVKLMITLGHETNWLRISCYKLSERAIDEFKDRLSWFYVSEKPMTEEFMRKHIDKLNFTKISKYQKLSNSFIEDFADLLEWNYISEYQNIDEYLLYKFKHRLNLDIIFCKSGDFVNNINLDHCVWLGKL